MGPLDVPLMPSRLPWPVMLHVFEVDPPTLTYVFWFALPVQSEIDAGLAYISGAICQGSTIGFYIYIYMRSAREYSSRTILATPYP